MSKNDENCQAQFFKKHKLYTKYSLKIKGINSIKQKNGQIHTMPTM